MYTRTREHADKQMESKHGFTLEEPETPSVSGQREDMYAESALTVTNQRCLGPRAFLPRGGGQSVGRCYREGKWVIPAPKSSETSNLVNPDGQTKGREQPHTPPQSRHGLTGISNTFHLV